MCCNLRLCNELPITEAQRPHTDVPPDALANFNAQIAVLGATANGVHTAPELQQLLCSREKRLSWG